MEEIKTELILERRKTDAQSYLDKTCKVADIFGRIVTEFGDSYRLYDYNVKDISLAFERLKLSLEDYMRQIEVTSEGELDTHKALVLRHEKELLQDICHNKTTEPTPIENPEPMSKEKPEPMSKERYDQVLAQVKEYLLKPLPHNKDEWTEEMDLVYRKHYGVPWKDYVSSVRYVENLLAQKEKNSKP